MVKTTNNHSIFQAIGFSSPGVMKVSEGDALFPWMRVGLGALAVVQEMTLKAPPG